MTTPADLPELPPLPIPRLRQMQSPLAQLQCINRDPLAAMGRQGDVAEFAAYQMRSYARAYGQACYAAGVRAGMERAAVIANSCECGDGSHDYNSGAATMQDNIDAAIRAAKHTKQQTE